MSAFAALVRKDVTLYLTNRRALLMALVAPVLIAAFMGAVLGGAPTKPVAVPFAVVDLDQSAISKRVVAAMSKDSAFAVQQLPQAQAIDLVRKGKLRAAAILPPGFGKQATEALFRPNAAKPQIDLHFDPSQAATLALIKGLLTQYVMQAVTAAAAPPELAVPYVTRDYQVTSGERSYNPYAHSFAGMTVQFILLMGVELGVGLLLMRRMGLWQRLRAAPLSRATVLGSRIASGTIIALLLIGGNFAAAILLFRVRIEGSVPGFVGVAVAFAVLTSSLGLLIAAVGRTPEATRGLAIVLTLLLVMLGGAWVPTFVFPQWLQSATRFVPTRWAIDGFDAMTWRAQALGTVLWPMAAMLGLSAILSAAAVYLFRWEE